MSDAHRPLRALVVAYAFPPCGGAGVQRIAKLVQYMPAFGVTPTVLTVRPSDHGLVDDTLYSAGTWSSIDAIRTACFDPVARYAAPKMDAGGGLAAGGRAPGPGRALRGIAKGLWTFAERHLLVPDRSILWAFTAVPAGRRAHGDRPFDVVLATGEPYSAFLIARRIARRLGVPYVLDMRDPWTLNSYREQAQPSWRQALERTLEARALRDCAACIFANGAIASYQAAFPALRDRFHYVPNGFDAADFAGLEPKPFDRFTIVHNGTFLPGYRTADTFLQAFARLLRDDPSMTDRVQVMFVGKRGEESEAIRRLGLSASVHQTGYLPHRESLSHLLGADALLLVGGRHAWEETGKVYEYLAAGKPILGVVEPDGAADRLLRQSPIAVSVGRANVDDTHAALKALVAAGRRAAAPPPAWLKKYERETLAGQMIQILTDCVAAPASRPAAVPQMPVSHPR